MLLYLSRCILVWVGLTVLAPQHASCSRQRHYLRQHTQQSFDPKVHTEVISKQDFNSLRNTARISFQAYQDKMSQGEVTRRSPIVLCHMIVMGEATSDYDKGLWENVAAAGKYCSWAVSWLTATASFRQDNAVPGVDASALEQHARSHNSSITFQQHIKYAQSFNKLSSVWKPLLSALPVSQFSHVWLLDSDISLVGTDLDHLFRCWRCGSGLLPPIISQPTITTLSGKQQAPEHVNYRPAYHALDFASVVTSFVEIQAPLVEIGFLSWFLVQIVTPFIEPHPAFALSEWGTDCIWCRAASLYMQTSLTSSVSASLARPLLATPCVLLPVPVKHASTRTVKRTRRSRHSGEQLKAHYQSKFPMFFVKHWKTDSERLAVFLSTTPRAAILMTSPQYVFVSGCQATLPVSQYIHGGNIIFFFNRTVSTENSNVGTIALKPRLVSQAPGEQTPVSLLTQEAEVEVLASVRGNLGPPSAVLSPQVQDWLKHRWQAASDMGGTPIPGPHWLQFQLSRTAVRISRVLIDYEAAFSEDYFVSVWCGASEKWQVIFDTAAVSDHKKHFVKKSSPSKHHVIHDIEIVDVGAHSSSLGKFPPSFDIVRLDIRRPATRFGTSVWRFEAYGDWL